MSSSHNNIKSNSSFELQAKADEWIDVTPTEELLRAELARLQEAFEKCTTRQSKKQNKGVNHCPTKEQQEGKLKYQARYETCELELKWQGYG